MTETHEPPTSEWTHSHAIDAGDELTDTNEDTPITVDGVNDDGSIDATVWIDERHGEESHSESWSEREVTGALADGIFERTDGLSHELATF